MVTKKDAETVVKGSITQQGDCQGGPLNGKPGMSRFSKGFLLVDKQAGKAWVYDWTGTAFICRDEPEGRPVDDTKRMTAAESSDWDVIAYAEGGAV
jgi:hypothetical protein